MNKLLPEIFIWPFIIGLAYFSIIVLYRFVRWTLGLSKIDKIRIWKGLRSRKTLDSAIEAFREGLLHRKIFRTNPVLGYMHMSLAFGWFLLIVFGHFEAVAYKGSLSFPVYLPIFFRFFVDGIETYPFMHFFASLMDLLLLFVLSGVSLAYYKRFNKKLFGMKKATRLKSGDRIALTALWLIFPLRLLAESFSAGQLKNGGIITQPLGNLFSLFVPLELTTPVTWLAYSFALGFFFVSLPNSRYMHIPAEVFFIFLRNYSVRLKKRVNTYSLVQVFSCSRCGICLDTCQLNLANIHTQSVYVLKNIRNKNLTDEVLFNCLLCGKCQQVCPVGIELIDLRITQRIESTLQYNSSYSYLAGGEVKQADVVYFAGCMTHLTPSIKKSMLQIFAYSGVDYWFMDEHKAPCCGRPLMQAGQYDAAAVLIENNQQKILASGAKKLVVSCPICYKVFIEDYNLPDIKVQHHSEYLFELMQMGSLPKRLTSEKSIYHDPCELGRGSGIYDKPRKLLSNYTSLIPIMNEKEKSLCCGGSLSNIKIQMSERDIITNNALDEYLQYSPDSLITSCPLCKKTFARGNKIMVKDISEVVAASIVQKNKSNACADKKVLEQAL
ncbi:MAG: 4Fe-4S dicluster domain-containing protein [Bacteroidales bacterium]|nr:4Fe-4S dicluster domain-containing protein [Bacteroidales bacterium]